MAVVEAGGIPKLISLLNSTHLNVADQAIWALGNIAGDGPDTRDIVLNNNIVDHINQLLTKEITTPFLQNIVWLMSNLCRNKNPPPPFNKILPMLPILVNYLNHPDLTVVSDICWAFSYISDDDEINIQSIIDVGALPQLIRILDIDNPNVITPALRTIGNIVTGNDKQTDAVINNGGLPYLAKLLRNKKTNIVKEAAWTVSNIAAGNRKQIQSLIDANIYENIIEVLRNGDIRAQKEAAWAVTNATTGGTQQQMIHLIKIQLMKPYCDLLSARDGRIIKIVLSGIENMFKLLDNGNSGIENLCLLIEEVGGLDRLESLQNHEIEDIYKKAFSLIDTYFSSDLEGDVLTGLVGTEVISETPTIHYNF